VQALVEGGHEVAVVCYFEFARDMVLRYEDAGADVLCLSESGSRPVGTLNSVNFLYFGFKKVIRELKPDVAHVQYMAPGAIPIILLKLLGVKRIVATSHTCSDIYPSLKLLHFLQKHVLNAFTCITELAEKSFFGSGRLYIPSMPLKKRGNHFTIYNALPKSFKIIDAPKEYSGQITVGVVSRLESIKGMDLVVPAFVKVHSASPNTRLIIVGDGSLRQLMEKQAEDAGLNDAVEFVGRQPQNALPDYYRKIDILLMPSRSEGFGLTAIEGMAAGCVVVAARTGGLPEVIKDGEVGLLHIPESVEDMAGKIEILLSDRTAMARLSASAAQYVKRFSFDTYSESFNNLYAQL